MDDRHRQGVKWTKSIGWILSLAALAFVGRWMWELDRGVWLELKNSRPQYLAVALILFLGWFYTRFLAWRLVSQRHGYQHGATRNIRMWAMSEFMRYIPGNVWSFAARWRGSIEAGASRVGATQALLIEALGLAGGAVLLVSLTLRPAWWWSGVLGTILYAWLMPRLYPLVLKKMRLVSAGSLSSRELVGLMIAYAASWGLFGLAHAAVYHSLSEPAAVSVIQLAAFSVLAWLFGYVSLVTPMGLGVREIALSGLLRSAGQSINFAAFFTVISRLWLIVSELVFLGLVLLWTRRK